ncbi:MAG: acetyl esterase [Paracoccaceae bacterium]
MDYTALIDAEIWAFIRKTGDYYPADAVALDIDGQRRVYDTMCRAFHQAYPPGVAAQDHQASGVPVRVYSAGQPTKTVVFFHGGGLVVGGLESHDDVCAEICAESGYRVVAMDYRLSPEHKHPAAFDDAWAATQWAADAFGDDLVLVGDSAGGNLAAAVAHFGRGRLEGIVGQVLIYPGLGGDVNRGSFVEHADAPMLTRDDVLFYDGMHLAEGAAQADPTSAPLHDTNFSNLPPTVIFTADCDPERDGGRDYRDQLAKAGVPVCWINEVGLVHGYLRARAMAARARASFERITVAVEALGQGIWPYD